MQQGPHAAALAAIRFSRDTFLRAEPYGEGHINCTFAVWHRRADNTEYRLLLQQINTHFHDTPQRYEALHRAIEADTEGRAATVAEEITFALERETSASELTVWMASGRIPYRVTHNDTKLNSILIDDVTGRGLCVIDLDSGMPGVAAFDFGDCIRFGANIAAEDETDLSKVQLDLNLFRVFAESYLHSAGAFLPPAEGDSLAAGARLITLECGVRFLTDYLDGDQHFRIHRPRHNLDRCRTQFALVANIERHMDEMRDIIHNANKKQALRTSSAPADKSSIP